MNIEAAILNVLETTPRPINADVVAAYVPQFFGAPVKTASVLAALERMKATDDVLSIANRDAGLLWKITANGKARIA